jgi:hypothetical protein
MKIDDLIRRRLTFTVLLAMTAALVWLNGANREAPWEHRAWGTLIFFLGLWPALTWVKKGGEGFPAFQVLGLAFLPTQAIPLFTKTDELAVFAESTITASCFQVVCFQLALIAGYAVVRQRPVQGRFWTGEILGRRAPHTLTLGISLATLYLLVTTFFVPAPPGLTGPLRAATAGITMVSAYILGNLMSAGAVTVRERRLLVVNIVTQAIVFASSLILVQAMSLVVVAILGYCSKVRKIPWAVILLSFAIAALLHNGKSSMRDRYWTTESRHQPSLTELPRFFVEWIELGLNPPNEETTNSTAKMTNKLLRRASLFQMLCLVNERTLADQYLRGRTYVDIPAQFVPRVLWSEKPSVHVSTSILGIHFGLQDENATQTTTIGFGYLAEAVANFGLTGALALGFLLGGAIKAAWAKTRTSSLLSPAGLLMIVLTAWCFETGQTLSVWLSSFYQAVVCILGLAIIAKKVFRG